MKTRRDLCFAFSIEDDAKKKKQIATKMRQNERVKRCEDKIARRHLHAKQREICKIEELSCVRETFDRKERETEMTHRLAAELSQREEVKRDRNLSRIKSSSQPLLNCDLSVARSRLIEERVRTKAKHAELSTLLNQDEGVARQEEDERKKRDLRVGLQNQIARNHRRARETKTKEEEQDRKEQEKRKIEKNSKNKKKEVNSVIFPREDLAASLAARNKWERKYRKALRDEDEIITCMVAEKEARDEKTLNEKIKVCAAIDAAIDKATKTFLDNVQTENEKKLVTKFVGRRNGKNK